MGRRRTNQAKDSPAICARFEWLLVNEFGNSITQMADALNVSNSALSRVISKGQMPSGEMLVSLAKMQRVNLDWLLAGSTEPTPERGPGLRFVPTVAELLPGPPDQHPALVNPLGLPISSPFRLGSPYLYRVPADSALARSTEPIGPGDYLVIETEVAWTQQVSAIIGRLVVLYDSYATLLIGRVEREEDYFAENRQFEVDTFGVFEQARLQPDCGRKDARTNSRKTKSRDMSEEIFFADDVVGVVVQLIRM